MKTITTGHVSFRYITHPIAQALVAIVGGLFLAYPSCGVAASNVVIERYFPSQAAAYQACLEFTGLLEFKGYATYCALGGGNHGNGSGSYYAGWYCAWGSILRCPENANSYLGNFEFNIPCPPNQVADMDTGTCHPSPKNPPSCPALVVGNPVNVGAGIKGQREADVALGGLRFERFYSSNSLGAAVRLGANWSHTLGRSISVKTLDLWLVAQRDDGRAYIFQKDTEGNWKSDADVSDQLTEIKNSAGQRVGWRYRSAATNEIESYDANGLLLSVADTRGYVLTLSYNLDPASGGDGDATTPDRISDSFGRTLRLAYDSQKRLSTVTDPMPSVFTFGYDGNNLSSVTYCCAPRFDHISSRTAIAGFWWR